MALEEDHPPNLWKPGAEALAVSVVGQTSAARHADTPGADAHPRMGAGQNEMAAAYLNCGAAPAASLAHPSLAGQHSDGSAHREQDHAADSYQQVAAAHWDFLWMAADRWGTPQAETARLKGQKMAMDRWGVLGGTMGHLDPPEGEPSR